MGETTVTGGSRPDFKFDIYSNVLKRTVLALLIDDSGNAAGEYALVACSFALAMLATMSLVNNAAVGQLTNTYSGLDNRNGVTP